MSRTVPDHFRALALDKQKLTGLFGTRIRANIDGFLENLDLDVLLRPLNTETLSTASSYREFAGQFLEAASDAYEYDHDLQLRAQMEKVATALDASVQRAIPSPDAQLTERSLLAARSDLQGLLAYYRVTSAPSAYATAQVIGSSLIKVLSSEAKRAASATDPLTLSKAGLIRPMLGLYRFSHNAAYLELCLNLAKSIQIAPIGRDMTSVELVRTLTALEGFADLYEITGNNNFLSPVLSTWKQIASGRLTVTGAPARLGGTDETIDTCSSSSWLQFTFQLLRLTGESGYGDELEKTVYNQLLASQDARNGNIAAEVPLNGRKRFSANLTPESGACALSESKALALLPRLVWGRYETGIAINLYTPGRAFFTLPKHGLVQIYSEGAFPEAGDIQLHVEPSTKTAKFPLRLRVPSWAEDFRVDIANIHLTGERGNVVSIDREWKSGDTVRISMTLPVRALSVADAPSDGFFLQRGPQILALGKTLNPEIADLNTALLRPVRPGQYQITNFEDKLPRNFSGDQVYKVSGELLNKPHEFLLAPFADAIDFRTILHASKVGDRSSTAPAPSNSQTGQTLPRTNRRVRK